MDEQDAQEYLPFLEKIDLVRDILGSQVPWSVEKVSQPVATSLMCHTSETITPKRLPLSSGVRSSLSVSSFLVQAETKKTHCQR